MEAAGPLGTPLGLTSRGGRHLSLAFSPGKEQAAGVWAPGHARGEPGIVPHWSLCAYSAPPRAPTFGGRRKAVRDRLALQGGTGDFP